MAGENWLGARDEGYDAKKYQLFLLIVTSNTGMTTPPSFATLFARRSVRCFGNNDSDQCSPPPGLKNGAVHVAAGPKNSACVTSGGLAFVWGCAKYSQSSPEPFSHSTASSLFTKVCCGLRHTLLLDDKGKVWGCGDSRHGQLCSDEKTVTALTEIQFEDDIGESGRRGENRCIRLALLAVALNYRFAFSLTCSNSAH